MNNAGWNPSYNARVSDITEPLKLEYQAMVYQNTGESWEDVGLSIATGTPSKNRSKPQLQPWSLDGGATQQRQSTANAWLKPSPTTPTSTKSAASSTIQRPAPHWRAGQRGQQPGRHRHQRLLQLSVPAGVSTVQYQSIGHRVETLNVSDPVMNVSLSSADVMLDALSYPKTLRMNARRCSHRALNAGANSAPTRRWILHLSPWSTTPPKPALM